MTTHSPQLTIFGRELIEEKTIAQMERCLAREDDLGVLTADAHYGYNHPIGGAVAYADRISVSGVGFDIACGNKAVRTNLVAAEVDVPRVMDALKELELFAMSLPRKLRREHSVIDAIAGADFAPQRALHTLAREQLGTVGGGNHYVDLFEDESGFLWIGVHFGSRGFGHKTATGFLALAQGKSFTDRAHEGNLDAPPVLFDTSTPLGQDYITAMELAGQYAYAGRDIVVANVLELLGAQATYEVHNHHNFAWREEHFGRQVWVVRKGCTPAFPGQQGFIGASMGDVSVIVEGVGGEAAARGLYSTVHGAGRVMSRTQAAGKRKWVKGKPQAVGGGLVDFEAVQARLRAQGIELRGGAADEAPEVYKKLDEVLACHEGTIRVLHRLRPLGVAMAGPWQPDPYKD